MYNWAIRRIILNSFETDIKRTVISMPFVVGIILEISILWVAGFDSDFFRMSIPVIATLPYSTAWLNDYESGYIKFYVSRTGIRQYIYGKILASAVSGGLVEVAGCAIYQMLKGNIGEKINLQLIFVSGMLWAVVSATMAAWLKSRYIAYGGSFVIYYLLVILHDRYYDKAYIFYPYEWIEPKNKWVFDEQGIIILITGIMLIVVCIYNLLLRRCIERV